MISLIWNDLFGSTHWAFPCIQSSRFSAAEMECEGLENAAAHTQEAFQIRLQIPSSKLYKYCAFLCAQSSRFSAADMESEGLENAAAHTQEAFETMCSFVPALVLKSALLLQIPDIIFSEGPGASLSLHQIAARLPTQTPNLDYLFRILRYLSARGVFIQSQADEQSDTSEVRFSLSECARLLYVRENNPASLVPSVLMQTHEAMMAPWQHLHECVLHGGHAFEKAHRMDFWDYAKNHPEINSVFNDCMASLTVTAMKEIVSFYRGFEELGMVVDVGGGNGAALGVIVKAFPHVRGINFDLPHVVQTAPAIPAIEHVGGNMFESIPHGDGIILKNVLHNWDDESCVKILDNCYKSLGEKGKLILLEAVVPNSQMPTKCPEILGDLVMMAQGNGGRERSEKEWNMLLSKSSFYIIKIMGHSRMYSKIIEAAKLNIM